MLLERLGWEKKTSFLFKTVLSELFMGRIVIWSTACTLLALFKIQVAKTSSLKLNKLLHCHHGTLKFFSPNVRPLTLREVQVAR